MSEPAAFHLTETPLRKGTTLIEASAGTGKTYTITALFLRLILEQNLSVREILVVTYTKAATEELRHRIRQTLVKARQAFGLGCCEVDFITELVKRFKGQAEEMRARLDAALCAFDEAPIFTMHGFCQRTLKDRAFETGILFDTELIADPSDLLQEIADDYWRKHFYEASSITIAFTLKSGCNSERLARFLADCSNYPLLKIRCGVAGRPMAALTGELEARFESARAVWHCEREAIQTLFGANAAWANSPYNNDAGMQERFRQLDACFAPEKCVCQALAVIEEFTPTALEKGKSKRAKAPVPEHRFFDLCAKILEAEENFFAGMRSDFLAYARAELPRRKAQQKCQAFDDLLTRLRDALAGANGPALADRLRACYPAALIDEFQDTDPVQYDIFHRSFGVAGNFLFFIGDPKQAIYGFRGADIFTYLQAAGAVARRYTLRENWRSHSGLVNAINSIFQGPENPFVFENIQFQAATAKGKADAQPLLIGGQEEAPFQFWFWRRTGKNIAKGLAQKTLPTVVADEIARLLNSGARIGDRPLKPEDIAVLVARNDQAQKMQEALAKINIPSVLHTTARLFESEEAAEFHRVLAAIGQPGNEGLVKAALTTELLGVGGAELAGFDERRWQETLARFHQYLELWVERGFFQMFRRWLTAECVRPRLLAFPKGERRLTNVLHLGETLHAAETERRAGVTGLLKWYAEQLRLGRDASEEHQLRLERDDNAARLVTIHKSKGLEYPVVFCPFSWNNSEIQFKEEELVLFHDLESQQLIRDLGPNIPEEHRNRAKLEKLAENVRLFYVGVTRAKYRCYFVWGGFNEAETSAPAWLLHQPPASNNVIKAMEENFPDDAKIEADLAKLVQRSKGTIAIADLPQQSNPQLYHPETETSQPLACRQFTGSIPRDWLVASYTYFASGQHEGAPDRDAIPAPAEEQPASGFFGFPKGSKAGTCLHEIFEKVDFAAGAEVIQTVASDRLTAHGFGLPEHIQSVSRAIEGILKAPLDPKEPRFTLSRISPTEQLRELEFYFPMRNVSARDLQKFFAPFGVSATVPWRAGRVQFNPLSGFLKGFIDLVFCFRGRYYILDWKSNWLGNQLEDYSSEAIRGEMTRHNYFLQYHLYVLALHKYLSTRLPGYNYNTHMGGAIYLFLRGVDPALPGNGIFRDLPQAESIERFAALFGGAL